MSKNIFIKNWTFSLKESVFNLNERVWGDRQTDRHTHTDRQTYTIQTDTHTQKIKEAKSDLKYVSESGLNCGLK